MGTETAVYCELDLNPFYAVCFLQLISNGSCGTSCILIIATVWLLMQEGNAV